MRPGLMTCSVLWRSGGFPGVPGRFARAAGPEHTDDQLIRLPRILWSRLRRVQDDALAEKVEAGAAVHLALDHLDLVDGALDLPEAMRPLTTACRSLRIPEGKERRSGWSSASTAASQASRSCLPLQRVIVSAKAVTCPASASMCGQRVRVASRWACLPGCRQSGRVSSQRVILRVFGTSWAGPAAASACRNGAT